jgi:Fe-S cluster biosynthesis and repair protein YggX
MANQISKQAIVDYIDNQIMLLNDSMESYTTKGKYYQILEQQRATLLSLNFNIKSGLFDKRDLDNSI